MDNPIFKRLQDAVEAPCRSKEWFGMAEQAINTIYALGEHPDALCNNLIKNLTRRAFEPKSTPLADPNNEHKDDDPADDDISERERSVSTMPASTIGLATQDEDAQDLGDAFELSQLVFVVGHVAIKQIVFLELVEREWKRQKNEKTAG